MSKWLLFLLALGVFMMSCSKPPPPPPPPEPEPIVEPEPEPEPQGPSEAELLAQRIQALLNQILGNKVYFEYNEFDLTEEAKTILAEVGGLMQNPEAGTITVKVEGHTDFKGTEEYNLALGEKRARKVMQYLESYGVGSDRLTIISYGEEQPQVEGEDDDSRQQNRRAQFQATSDN